MARIERTIRIAAPRERCFDLARSVDVHVASAAETGERAVAGRTSGLLELHEETTWQATHFGLRFHLTIRITAFERPHRFRDSMVRGPFARLDHDHEFEDDGAGGTLARDLFDYAAPLALLGRLAERLFLTRHLTRFLETRNLALKRIAESEEWKRYLDLA
jgi:ligand-binding SRPBCC domain-containing protein